MLNSTSEVAACLVNEGSCIEHSARGTFCLMIARRHGPYYNKHKKDRPQH